jgi:hypothetical protein
VCVHACMFAREGCWGIRVCAIVRDGENSPHFYKSFFIFGFLVAFVEEKLHFSLDCRFFLLKLNVFYIKT